MTKACARHSFHSTRHSPGLMEKLVSCLQILLDASAVLHSHSGVHLNFPTLPLCLSFISLWAHAVSTERKRIHPTRSKYWFQVSIVNKSKSRSHTYICKLHQQCFSTSLERANWKGKGLASEPCMRRQRPMTADAFHSRRLVRQAKNPLSYLYQSPNVKAIGTSVDLAHYYTATGIDLQRANCSPGRIISTLTFPYASFGISMWTRL